MSKITSNLYSVSRTLAKIASTIVDIETIASGDPNRIAKRAGRKLIYKTGNKMTRKVARKL